MPTRIVRFVRGRRCVITFVAVGLAAGCDAAPAGSAHVIRDSAGVALVENFAPGWSPEAAWVVPAEPTVEIGAADGPDELVFHGVSGTYMGNGQIVVANEGTGEIRFFTPAGDFLRAQGGSGEGPGEYRSIARIGSWRADSLFVYDSRLNRVSILDAPGGFVRSFTSLVHTDDLLPIGHDSWVGTDGSTLRPGSPGATARDTAHFLLWDPTATVADTVTSIPGQKTFTFSFRGEEGYRTAPLTPSPVWAVSGDLLLVSSGEDFQVTVLRQDGSVERIVRRVEEVVPATAADFVAWQEDLLTQVPEPARPEFRSLLGQFPAPSHLPTYRKLLVDPTKHLWLERFRAPSGPSGVWDVFTPEGVYLGEVKIPAGVEVFQVTDDHIVGSWSDDTGVETVRVYEIGKDSGRRIVPLALAAVLPVGFDAPTVVIGLDEDNPGPSLPAEERAQGEIEGSAARWDTAPSEVWRLVPDLRIGALDGPAAFGWVVDMEVAPDGRMFVADHRSLRISIFAPDGTFLGGFGRSGGGPGEFRSFSRLSLARGGLHVFDLTQMRLSRFSLDGEFLGSWGPPTWGVPPPLQVNGPEVALADGSFLVDPMLMSPYDSVPETPLARYGAARDSLGVLAWLETGASRIRAETDTCRIGFEPPVHDGTLWDVSPGGQRLVLVYRSTTAASDENSFRVMALSPAGDTLLDRTFPYTPVPVDRAAAEARRRGLVDYMVNNRPVTRRVGRAVRGTLPGRALTPSAPCWARMRLPTSNSPRGGWWTAS